MLRGQSSTATAQSRFVFDLGQRSCPSTFFYVLVIAFRKLFLVDVTSLCLGVGDDCDAAMSLRCCAVLRGAVMSDCVLLRVTSLSLSSLCCCETSAVTDMQTTRAADN